MMWRAWLVTLWALGVASGCAAADAAILVPTVEIVASWRVEGERAGQEAEALRADGAADHQMDWSVVAMWDISALWAEEAP